LADFFTVEEAARVLRIGRTAAYALARRWRETGGEDGLPVVAFGRLLRVPRTALEALTGGPIPTVPPPKKAKQSAQPEPVVEMPGACEELVRPVRRRHARKRSVSPDQTSFPLT
jgi:excisionase family DNA binding protein